MDKKENPEYNKNVQKILKTTIANEKICGEVYANMILAVKPDELHLIHDSLVDLGKDELDDHYIKLVKYAVEQGYDVPFGSNDLEKFGNETGVKMFKHLAKNANAEDIVKKAIKLEEIAIKDYEDALSTILTDDSFADLGNLRGILLSIYTDEHEHFEHLNFLYHNIKTED